MPLGEAAIAPPPNGDPPARGAAPAAVPPPVERVEDTGLSGEFIGDLLLKLLYTQGPRTGEQISEAVCIPFTLVDTLLLGLQQRRMMEVLGTNGPGRFAYRFDLTGLGRERAQEAFEASQYVGPAPVPLDVYRAWVDRQTIRNVHVTRESIQEGFRHIVMEPALFETLGPAINSAKSLFLYGDSGNGKTLIAEAIANLIGDAIYVPHAVEVNGQILVLHDPVYHRPAREPAGRAPGSDVESLLWRRADLDYDRRFARVKRPVVVAGGELTLEQLDLQYDPFTKVYQAPFQMKANGGVLIIDDFGRQRVPPRDLLNRWIVPLEKRIDYLTLHTGGKFPVPFDSLMIVSTNLDPTDLVEEAFLRRIHYKVSVDSPSREQYAQIFRRVCDAHGITYEAAAVEFLFRDVYGVRGIPPRSCHPRDLLDHVCDEARFLGQEPTLSRELLRRACDSYFVQLPGTGS